MWDDRELRELHQALRRRDAARAPAFQALLRRERRARRWPARPLALAGLLLAAALLAWLLPREPKRPAAAVPEATLARWESPTAFLLRPPGQELLTTLPAIGPFPDVPDKETQP